MPDIPSLPIAQPVEKPQLSVQQMRSAGLGEGVELADQGERIAAEGMDVEGALLAAQRQLAVKQGEIAFDKYQEQAQTDLSKTTSVDDVDRIHENYQNDAPTITTPYSKDPRVAQALGLYAQSQSVEMQRTVNARKAKIVTDQDMAANQLKGDKATQDWTNAFLSGGDVSIAEGDEQLTLQSSVVHGTMTQARADAEFNDWLMKTKQKAIEGITHNPDAVANQKFIDQIKSGNVPKELSGLGKEFLNHALDAAEDRSATLKARAESRDVNAKFNGLLGYFKEHPTLFPTPEAKLAATADPDVLKAVGAISPDGLPDYEAGKKLRELYASVGSDEKTALKVKADKEFDDISKLIAENKLGEAQVALDKNRQDFEAVDDSYYRGGESAIRQRIDYNEQQERFGRSMALQDAEAKGKQNFSRLMKNVAENKPVDFQKDILPLLISGDITSTQVRSAMAMSTLAQKDEGVRTGLRLIQEADAFKVETDTTNLEMSELGFAYTNIVQQQGLKGKDAFELAGSMADEANKKSVSDAINDAFSWKPGTTLTPKPGWWSNFVSGLSQGTAISVGETETPAASGTTPKQPTVVERRVTKSGKTLEKLSDGTIREGH